MPTQIRRKMGLLSQRPFPLPMSIYDNVAYGLRLNGLKDKLKVDAVVEHYLKMVGLWEEVRAQTEKPGMEPLCRTAAKALLGKKPCRGTRGYPRRRTYFGPRPNVVSTYRENIS